MTQRLMDSRVCGLCLFHLLRQSLALTDSIHLIINYSAQPFFGSWSVCISPASSKLSSETRQQVPKCEFKLFSRAATLTLSPRTPYLKGRGKAGKGGEASQRKNWRKRRNVQNKFYERHFICANFFKFPTSCHAALSWFETRCSPPEPFQNAPHISCGLLSAQHAPAHPWTRQLPWIPWIPALTFLNIFEQTQYNCWYNR